MKFLLRPLCLVFGHTWISAMYWSANVDPHPRLRAFKGTCKRCGLRVNTIPEWAREEDEGAVLVKRPDVF